MFQRFTDRARRVVVLAEAEMRRIGHDYIGTEHLLLGLIAEERGIAAKELVAAGMNLERASQWVEQAAPPGAGTPRRHIPFTPHAKRVLERALREARELGDNFIDTEHILLGLVDESDGLAAPVLNRLGGSPEALREGVLARIAADREEGTTTPCCPRCRAELSQTLSLRTVSARKHEGNQTRAVVVIYCGACGASLGAYPE